MTATTSSARSDQGLLVLRLAIAGLLLVHGVSKLGSGVDWIGGMLTGLGLPGFLAYGAYVGEIVAPLLVLAGILTRPAALVMAFQMVAATLLARRDAVFTVNPQSGGLAIELELLFLLGAVAIALLGPGRYAVRPD
jgi:putative oxidoreductase